MGDFKVFPYSFPQSCKIKCSLQTTSGTRYGNRVWNCSQFPHDRVLLRLAFNIPSYVAQHSLGGSRVITFLNSREAVERFARQRNANASSIKLRGRRSARRGLVIASVDRNVHLKYQCSSGLQFTFWCAISCCRSSSTHESSDPPFRVIVCIICMLYSSTWIHHTRFRRSRDQIHSTNGENEDAGVAAYTNRRCACDRHHDLCSRRRNVCLRTPRRKVHLNHRESQNVRKRRLVIHPILNPVLRTISEPLHRGWPMRSSTYRKQLEVRTK